MESKHEAAFADRFALERVAGRGGMGTIYRARDLLGGRIVALKVLHPAGNPEAHRRFIREAELLAGLSHPGIVAHVAHGVTGQGQPYLAMEWLEGEDLARRLARQPLSQEESLALLRRAAEALALAHQRGVIHRDLKPSNLFLREGRAEDVVLLDFGLARHLQASAAMTASGAMVGTPGYMAPEQVTYQTHLTAAVDVFSLGCVLYECLTGQAPFTAPHFAAVLAKILFAEPAPLRTLRAELPGSLQALLERMLAKEPSRRLVDARALLEALQSLESPTAEPERATAESQRPARLSGAEQQLVSVLLAAPSQREAAVTPSHSTSQVTLCELLRKALGPLGARVELLADGSLVATLLLERGAATDQAVQAARHALFVKRRWPEAAVALATGRGVLSHHLPVGEAMDRAGWLLRQLGQLPAPAAEQVVLDPVTAGLLGPEFQLTRSQPEVFLLSGEQPGVDASRPLLGKPTPCVGREQELALLELTFSACVEEPSARSVLVVAPAGAGKSRLRHEFLRRLQQREPRVRVLPGRGDPMSTGSAYALLGQAVRHACGVVAGEELEVRRGQLTRHVQRLLPLEQAQEVAEFLGELCGIPFPEEGRPRLRAARGDPRLMSLQVSQALVGLLRAECQRGPVVLVLEDLHWADPLTITLVGEALRELAEQPLLVLALARPEVRQLFPGLWGLKVQELALRGLSRKASALLVRQVLGPGVAEGEVERLVAQCSGNALFLEELIRRAAEGRGDSPPETVLAMLQSRLLRLEPGPRQALLAASFFGSTLWASGVQALLAEALPARELEHRLHQLVELEIIELHSPGRFPSEVEYRFRHALVREAAYSLVAEGDRPVGHRLAAAWLERAGESDPLVLAEHYRLGQEPQQAVGFYAQAAEQLLGRSDSRGALRCVEAALACGAQGEVLVRLRVLEALSAFWLNEPERLFKVGEAVLPELRVGSVPWCRLLGCLIISSALGGEPQKVGSLSQLLLGATPEPDAVVSYLESTVFIYGMLLWLGASRESSAFFARMMEVGAPLMAGDAAARGWVHHASGLRSYFLEGRLWQALWHGEQGIQAFREAGMERISEGMKVSVALELAALGDGQRALPLLREAQASVRRMGERFVASYIEAHLCLVLAGSSEPGLQQEARELALRLVGGEERDSLRWGLAYVALARVALRRGELEEAEVYGRKACELLAPLPSYVLLARAALCSTLLARHRVAEAREEALRGAEELERMGGAGAHAVAVHLALAESCLAAGEESSAEAALQRALQWLRERAGDAPDEAARERFLSQVPENARVLERARQRWGEGWVL